MSTQDLRLIYDFLNSLGDAGVEHICISPGSRSTPLTIAAERLQRFTLHTLLDERSAGFFALGLSKATNRAVALICTSGTATANYYPAIMEAKNSRVPLVVLTADRPPELRQIGSNQTVVQTYMYGTHVKWSYELPVPEEELRCHFIHSAVRAVHIAEGAPAGPVHLNLPFREPLIPPKLNSSEQKTRAIRRVAGRLTVDDACVSYLRTELKRSRRPVIVVGPQLSQGVAALIREFALAAGTPIFADVLSQVRTNVKGHERDVVLTAYDLWLSTLTEKDYPDFVLRFGQTVTSKPLNLALRTWRAEQWVVDDDPHWLDAVETATTVLTADAKELLQELLKVDWKRDGQTWVRLLQERDDVSRTLARSYLESGNHEAQVAYAIWQAVSDDVQVMVGNSMPIRDFDAFFEATEKSLLLYGNRGVSGIDGVVSTTAGIRAATGKRTVLVIGDVSFFHDLNGLLAAREAPITIVLVDNDGGGIFRMLPQAEHLDTLHQFVTPHGLHFEPVVRMYGGAYEEVSTSGELVSSLTTALTEEKLHVIVYKTDAEKSHEWRKQVREAVRATWGE